MCSSYTDFDVKAGATNCEIAFGATGYDTRLLAVVHITSASYRDFVFNLTQQHLEALRRGDIASISRPEFLVEAIPAYMRAAYLRAGIDADPMVELDLEVAGATKEYAQQVSDVFLNGKEPFEVAWRDNGRFRAERGAVRFEWKGKAISVVFFDQGAPQ